MPRWRTWTCTRLGSALPDERGGVDAGASLFAGNVPAVWLPQIVKANTDEFYPLQGDMIDYVYALWREVFAHRRLFSATFEFGTLGESLYKRYCSQRAMVFENRLHWHGAQDPAVRARVERDFKDLFFPEEPDWCAKALADFRQATEGILRAEGVLTT